METENCAICGRVIKDDGVLRKNHATFVKTPFVTCVPCQQQYYRAFVHFFGYKLSLFLCCAVFDRAYVPEVAANSKSYTGKSGGIWIGYIAALRKYEQDMGKEPGELEFGDGVTEIKKAFDGKTQTLFISDEYLEEDEYLDSLYKLRERWGDGPKNRPYTADDYMELERICEALTAVRNVTAQMELAVEKIAKWTVEQNYCVQEGDFQKAKWLEDLIKVEMESEQLRKKDELPQDLEKISGIVKACEEKGLLGLSLPELMKKLHPHYEYPLDVADQILLAIYNTSAWNEGMPPATTVPEQFALKDDLDEFSKDFDADVKDIYGKIGIPLPKPEE